jgi:putative oxidoreductase
MSALDLLGLAARLLFLVVFVRGGYSGSIHLSNTIATVARTGAPFPWVTVPASQVLQWVGIISVTLGIWADIGALCLLLFLFPVTYWTHAFWRLEGQPRQVQLGNFLRNLTYLGGVLLILHAALAGALPLTVTGPLLTIR